MMSEGGASSTSADPCFFASSQQHTQLTYLMMMTLPLKRDNTKVSVKGGKPAPKLGSTHGFGWWIIPFCPKGEEKTPKIWQQSHGSVICRWMNVLRMRTYKRWQWVAVPIVGSSAQQIEMVTITSVPVPRSFLSRFVLFQPSPFASHFSLTYHRGGRQSGG